MRLIERTPRDIRKTLLEQVSSTPNYDALGQHHNSSLMAIYGIFDLIKENSGEVNRKTVLSRILGCNLDNSLEILKKAEILKVRDKEFEPTENWREKNTTYSLTLIGKTFSKKYVTAVRKLEGFE